MPSDSEFPFALLLGGSVLAVLLALSAADVATLTGRSAVEAAAALAAVPLALGLAVGTLARDRFGSRRFAAVGTVSIAALVALLEVAAVAVAANRVDLESLLIALVGSVLASVIARRRFGA